MAELLSELFSEEIPARMQARAAEDLRRLVTEGLRRRGSRRGGPGVRRRGWRWWWRACRPSRPTWEERKGRVNAPERAIAGFRRRASTFRTRMSSRTRRRATSTSCASTSRDGLPRRSSARWCPPSPPGSRGPSRCAGGRGGRAGCGRCIRSSACSMARWCRSRSRRWRPASRRAGIASTGRAVRVTRSRLHQGLKAHKVISIRRAVDRRAGARWPRSTSRLVEDERCRENAGLTGGRWC